jgi:lysophospholipase L1-like esterase
MTDSKMGRYPMLDRPIRSLRAIAVLVAATMLSSCGSPSRPTVVTPPTQAPAITCPASATVQSIDGNPVPVPYADPVVTGGQAPLTLTCTPVSGALYPVGPTSVSCTVTDAQRRPASCTFAITVVVLPKPVISVTRFVAFGDSITWGENGQNATAQGALVRPALQFPLFQTYPGVLNQLLSARYSTQAVSVDNQGLKGEAVTGAITAPKEPAPARFSRTIAGGRYDVALIMEGANDLANRDDRVDPAVIAGLRTMILDAKSRGMRVLLATIPPEFHGCCPDRGLASGLVAPLNDQVRGLAFEQAVPLVDVYAALNDDVSTYIGPDGLHPTTAGYSKIADTFFSVIKQTLEVTPAGTSTTLDRTRSGAGALVAPVVRPPIPRAPQPRRR